uniref:Disease resistance N-terminal domain-containing protein n=1 Tax=Opuntia streptacantha TaxID=393608 RepID=A0A7C9FAF6_OPUST
MAEDFLFDVAKSLGSSLVSYTNDQLLLAWKLGSEVEKLKGTIDTINAYFKDVEERPGGITTHSDRDWLTKLRKAVYDADDVFDEIVTIAERKRLTEGNTFGNEAGNYQILIALTFRLQTKLPYLNESPGTFVALNICNPLKFFK